MILALGALACSSSGGEQGGRGGDVLAEAGATLEVNGETGAETSSEITDAINDAFKDNESAMDTTTPDAPDAPGEVAAEETSAPGGCDLEAEADSLWALTAPDRDTGDAVGMCNYRGDVVLIVNTAAS